MAFAVACFQRLGPLLRALWMIVDVGLDIRQAIVYRKYAIDRNGTYINGRSTTPIPQSIPLKLFLIGISIPRATSFS